MLNKNFPEIIIRLDVSNSLYRVYLYASLYYLVIFSIYALKQWDHFAQWIKAVNDTFESWKVVNFMWQKYFNMWRINKVPFESIQILALSHY